MMAQKQLRFQLQSLIQKGVLPSRLSITECTLISHTPDHFWGNISTEQVSTNRQLNYPTALSVSYIFHGY
ncbi:hypothetical protein DIRU0_A06876 [Diutina rugosa]